MNPESTPEDTWMELDSALAAALTELPASPPLVLLFSGGVDSGLLAWELRGRAGLRLSTFGVEGNRDVAVARAGAELIGGLAFSASTATPEQVLAMSERISRWVGPLSPTERSVETAFALAVETAPPGPLVCGQGADELFFGYAHYQGLTPPEAAARADADLARVRVTAWPRTQEVARRLGRTVFAPYLAPRFVAAACAIPASVRFTPGAPKFLFRQWARHRGLPPEIADRPKKALQYGSGVDRLLKKRAPRP